MPSPVWARRERWSHAVNSNAESVRRAYLVDQTRFSARKSQAQFLGGCPPRPIDSNGRFLGRRSGRIGRTVHRRILADKREAEGESRLPIRPASAHSWSAFSRGRHRPFSLIPLFAEVKRTRLSGRYASHDLRRHLNVAHRSTAFRRAAMTGQGTPKAVINSKLFSRPDFSEAIQEDLPAHFAHR